MQLYGAGTIGATAAHVVRVARRNGFNYNETEIRNALYFLEGQGLVSHDTDAATGETRYRITSRGMIEYENREHGDA